MNDQKTEEKLASYLRTLDEELAPSVTAKLKAARIDALNTEKHSRKSWIMPALAFASLACISMVVIKPIVVDLPEQNVQSESMADMGDFSSDDLALLSAGDEFEFLENVEFILWLSELDDGELG